MSRMGTAQKLSVAQLKQAVQDGTLPAYVGIPLIQDKLKQQQEAQAGKPVPPQPPIADQILQEADQSRGIDEAQSNLPTMNAAEGGIISYALGGDVEDDYEDQLQEEADSQDLGYAQMMAQANENEGMLSAKEPSYVNKTPSVGFGIKPPTGGVDALLSHIISKESGGRDYDEKGRPLTSNKGAKFAMQVLDSTAKDPGFGIKPAKDMTAAEYNRVGKELATALLDKYQDPKLAAIAYNWGAGNTDKWLANGANPQKLPKETQGYLVGANFADGGIVALAAGGAVPSYAKGDVISPEDYDASSMLDDQSMATVPNPALQRSYNLVSGIKSLGSNIGTALTTPRNYDPITKLLLDPARSIQRWGQTPLPEQAAAFRSASMTPNQNAEMGYTVPAGSNTSVLASNEIKPTPIPPEKPDTRAIPRPQDLMMLANIEGFNGDQFTINPPSKESAQDTTKAPTELSAWDKYLQGITEERQSLKEQKEEDKYLSLMAAGLGTLKASGTVEPGKVHTATGDIATGGMEGVAYYANAAKQRAAQQAALNKELGLGMYRQEIAKATAGNKGIEQQMKRDAFAETQRMNQLKEREFNIKSVESLESRLRAQWSKDNAMSTDDEATKKQKQDDFVYNNPIYQNAWERANPDIKLPSTGGGNVQRFDKNGNPIK
jgi:hypothetical protein